MIQNQIIFWANNTSGIVDFNRVHRWRLNTYDYYTGAAYGIETDVHVATEINIPYTNNTHLASSNYANDTVAWNVEFNNPILTGVAPMSAYHYNITFYTDAGLVLTRTNDTHTFAVSQGQLSSIWVEEYEYWFDWQNLATKYYSRHKLKLRAAIATRI